MKLKELLKVIPDNYLIGLMDSDVDNYSILAFGNKKDCYLGVWSEGKTSSRTGEESECHRNSSGSYCIYAAFWCRYVWG